MATSVGPKNPSANNGSGWTSPSSAYADGGAAATDGFSGTSNAWSAYDFSAIPSTGTVTIIGIEVKLDAWVDVVDGTDPQTLTVDCSWNNGSNYTSTKNTGALTDTEATYTLGGPTDTWGRTWTRAELQSGQLRTRVKTANGSVLQGWNLDWVRVTVYYTVRYDVDASAAGTGSATGAPGATFGVDGSASGVGSVSGAPAEILSSVASAAGTGSAAGTAAIVLGSVGTAAGSATAVGVPLAPDSTGSTTGDFATAAGDAGWINGYEALHDGGGYSYNVDDASALQVYGATFKLPTDAYITGVVVEFDAWKNEAAGSGTLKLRVEISADGGSTWSATTRFSTLTTSETRFSHGGAADTWGISISPAGTASLRIRLTTEITFGLDVPEFRLDYARATVHYADVTPVVGTYQENITASDGRACNRAAGVYEERELLGDGPRGRPSFAFTGGAVDEIQVLPSDFITAITPRNARTALAMILFLRNVGGGSSTIYVGDDIASQGGVFQQGVLAWDAIQYSGSPGVDVEYADAGCTIRNAPLSDLAGNTKTAADWLRATYAIGSTVWLFALAESGGVWNQRVVFQGTVSSIILNEATVEIRFVQEDLERKQIPTLELGPAFMNYGPDEGKLPAQQSTVVVPIAFGRFDPSALKSWPSTSVLAELRHGTYLGAALGLKFPMIPIPLVADEFVKKTGSALATTQRQALFAFGDIQAGIAIGNYAPGAASSPYANAQFDFPKSRTATPMEFGGIDEIHGTQIFLWDEELDRALPFARDQSSSLPAEAFFSGAGIWPEAISTAALGSRAQGFYVTRINPLWAGASFSANWGGALGSAFISPRGFAQYPVNTNGVPWLTTGGVLNPQRGISRDLSEYATIPSGQLLGVQFQGSAPSAGDVIAIRVWLICDRSSAATQAKLWFRNSWNIWRTVLPNWNSMPNAQSYGTADDVQGNGIACFEIYQINGDHAAAWDFTTGAYRINQSTGALFPWNWEVAVQGIGGELRVAHIALEVVYRSRFAAGVGFDYQLIGTPTSRPGWRADPHPPMRPRGGIPGGGLPRGNLTPPFVGVATDPIKPLGETHIYITGQVGIDTAQGTYTGTASSLIECPPDVAGFVIDKYLGDFPAVARGSTFGSFTNARDILFARLGGRWNLSPILPSTIEAGQFFADMAAQSMSFCERQPGGAGIYEWRWFVDGPAPHTDDPTRLYRGTGFYFDPVTIFRDSLVVSTTDIADLYSQFTLRYGYHEPTGQFAYSMQVDRDSDTLLSLGSNYRAACLAVETQFNIRRRITFDAPNVWHPGAADSLIKWHCNLRRQRRHLVDFVTGPNGLDLMPGHVIRFDDSLATWHKYPGTTGSSAWSAHNFVVVRTTIETETLQPMRVRVAAIETYTEA